MAPFVDQNNGSHLYHSGDLFAALQDTIVITLNHRVDLFSTLYVDGEFNGNLVLFDQNLAFNWVKKYIHHLCGDENSLTLFGDSQGGRSIGMHMISNYSKHLFSNGIMQSYSPLFSVSFDSGHIF